MVTMSSHFEPYILSNSTVLHSVTVWSHIILRQIQPAILYTKKVWNFGQNPLTYKHHLENVTDGTVTLKWILSKCIGVLWAGPT